MPIPPEEGSDQPWEEDPYYYDQDRLWPDSPEVLSANNAYREFRMADPIALPFEWDSRTGTLSMYRSIDVTLELEPVPANHAIPERQRRERRLSSNRAEVAFILERALNAEDLDRYYPGVLAVEDRVTTPTFSYAVTETTQATGFRPTDRPSLQGSPVEMVIVTGDQWFDGTAGRDLRDTFQRLADWRTKTGIPTVVRSLQWIRENYRGTDDPERIRKFLIEAYGLWGTDFVLLGGDYEVVPSRLLDVPSFGYYDFPTDYYFAGFDQNWNPDGDSYSQRSELATAIDKYPEVWIGRIPVRDPGEATAWLEKAFTYERAPGFPVPSNNLYYRGALLAAGLTRSGSWDTFGNGLYMAERVKTDVLDQTNFNTTRLYPDLAGSEVCDGGSDTHPCWSGIKSYFGASYPSGRINAANMRDQLDSGLYSIFFHMEHSERRQLGGPSEDDVFRGDIGPPISECEADVNCTSSGCVSWEDECWDTYQTNNIGGGLHRELASSIDNGPAYFIGLSYGSFTGRFEQDSITDALIRDPDGGAVAFASKTTSANAPPDDEKPDTAIPRRFFLDLLSNRLTCGQSIASARTHQGQADAFLIWHLFGDPSLVAWSDVPKALDLTVDPDTLGNPDYYEFTVTVNAAGPVAVDSARVCLFRDPDIFAVARTDLSGVARFPAVLVADVTTPITVWTVAENAVPESTFVEPANFTTLEDEPSLIYNRHVYDDSGDPGYTADLLEAGDRFDLDVELVNRSAETVSAGKAKLGVTPRVRGWLQVDGAHANNDVWIGRALAHPPALADTFLLHVNEYGIRPELPPSSFSDYGYYVYRDTTFVYHVRAHYDPSIYGQVIAGAFAADGGVVEDSETIDSGDNVTIQSGPLGDEIAFSLTADATDDLFSFTAEAADWVTLHERWDEYASVNQNETATVTFDLEFTGLMPPRTPLDFTVITRYDEDEGGSFPVFSDFALNGHAPEPEIAFLIPRTTTTVDCGTGTDYLMKVRVRNLGETGINDAVIRVAEWTGAGATLCTDTLHVDLAPGEERETWNGIRFSDTGAFFTIEKLQVETAAGDVLQVLEGAFSPVPHTVVVTDVAVTPAPGGMQVTWTPPSPPSSVLGYHVYADTSGTPYRLTDVPLSTYSQLWALDLPRYQSVGEDPIQYEFGVSVIKTLLTEGTITWFGGTTPIPEEVALTERAGFPVRMPKGSVGSVALVNLDSDAALEILAAGRVLAAWNPNGTSATSNSSGLLYDPFDDNGTYDQPFLAFQGEVAVADIDGDPALEIAGCFGDGKVYVVQSNGTLQFSPKSVASKVTPIIADLDGNSYKEIVIHEHRNGNVYVFQSNGNPYGTDSSGLYIDPSAQNNFTYVSLAVAPIDGAVRIVQPTTAGTVYVWKTPSGGFGNPPLLTSYTISGSSLVSTPVVADVDDDGDVDVVVRTNHGGTGSVVAFEGENATLLLACCGGTDLFLEDIGGGLDLHLNPLSVGDLGNDGQLEIVTGTWDDSGTEDEVYVAMAYDTDAGAKSVRGQDRIPLPGRRFEGSSTLGYPVLADWDGDGTTEILIGSNYGGLFCWEPQWNESTDTFSLVAEKGWPILHRDVQGSPAVGDIDSDGFSELVVSTDDGHVHAYDLPGIDVVWAAAGYDLRRSGYVPISSFAPNDPRENLTALETEGIAVGANPFREEARIRFRTIQSGPAAVLVFDASGRRVRTLLEAGSLEPGIHEVIWNGRDDSGSAVPAGVYFGLVRTGQLEFRRRLVRVP